MIKAVLFDLDGTILDTEKYELRFWRVLLGYCAPKELLLGVSTKTILKTFNLTEEAGKLIDAAMMNINKFPVKPGFYSLLFYLKRHQIPYALATSSTRVMAKYKLRYLNLVFPEIVAGTDVQNGKPAPDIFLLAAKKLGFAPEECVGIEDSPAGLQALQTAGIRSIFIKDLLEPPDKVAIWAKCKTLRNVISIIKYENQACNRRDL